MYSFDLCCSTLSVLFNPEMSAEDVTNPLTGGETVGCNVLNNGAKMLLLDGLCRLDAA